MNVGHTLKVWETTGHIIVEASHADGLDAAVSHYLDTGRDSLLHLVTPAGADYVTRASNVLCWLIETPEQRRRATEYEKASGDENRDNRISAGLPWEEAA